MRRAFWIWPALLFLALLIAAGLSFCHTAAVPDLGNPVPILTPKVIP